MNKLFILALFIALSFAKRPPPTTGYLTEYVQMGDSSSTFEVFRGLMSGLSEEGMKSACVGDITNAKKPIIRIFDMVKEKMADGDSFASVITEAGNRIKQIRNINEDCQIDTLMDVYSTLLTKNGLTSLSNQIKQNVSALLQAGSDLKAAMGEKDSYRIGFHGGVLARLLLKITVS